HSTLRICQSLARVAGAAQIHADHRYQQGIDMDRDGDAQPAAFHQMRAQHAVEVLAADIDIKLGCLEAAANYIHTIARLAIEELAGKAAALARNPCLHLLAEHADPAIAIDYHSLHLVRLDAV